jgi:malate permease and related proteins
MNQAAAGILKIVIFLVLGVSFRTGGVLKKTGIAGIKKIILDLAIPAVLFLSFSRLEFKLSFIPVILAVFSINFILFWIGVLLYKATGSKFTLLPLILSTMNFALLGIPLYDAVYGIDNLHHYTMLGVGHEFFMWFVFYFLFRWFLSGGREKKGINTAFLKSPIIWSIVLGCLFSILKIDISDSGNALVLGISESISSASMLTTPLILIFIGYNISISFSLLVKSIKYIIIRLLAAFAIGFLFKFIVLDRFIESSVYYDSAYFLLLALPPVFAIPILAADYLEEDDLILLNNIIVTHALVTVFLFTIFSFATA